jgi:serine/threonine protein kinase
MCKILHCLHKQDRPIIHRDFSPENLILTKSGKLCLIDFNVAQFWEGQASKTIVGKKSYVPPEQLRGETVPASDLYALGATLYFISTGKDPEPISTAHPRSLNQNLSDSFDSLVSFLTVPNVSDRCKNTDALRQRLQQHGHSSSLG